MGKKKTSKDIKVNNTFGKVLITPQCDTTKLIKHCEWQGEKDGKAYEKDGILYIDRDFGIPIDDALELYKKNKDEKFLDAVINSATVLANYAPVFFKQSQYNEFLKVANGLRNK